MTEDTHSVTRTSTHSLILLSVFCSLALGSLEYHFINVSRSYDDARSYCRETYADLATVPSSRHMRQMIDLVGDKAARAWIGLESRGVWMWHWSLNHRQPDFFKWRSGEPRGNNEDVCAAMDSAGEWFESDCSTKRGFVCQNNGDTGGHLFVAEAKSWRDAQSRCRDVSSDLASIHSEEENTAVQSASASRSVWIGLFKDPWMWSDGSNSSFRFWRPAQPNYLPGQNCTAAVFRSGGLWNDLRCSLKRHFVCHSVRESTTAPNPRSTAAAFATNHPTAPLPATPDSSADPTTSPEVSTPTTAAPNTDLVKTTSQTPNVTAPATRMVDTVHE